MSAPARLPPLDQLPVAPASSVKKDGWRGMMRALSAEGRLLITNHNQPEAVILSTAEYARLLEAARRQPGHARPAGRIAPPLRRTAGGAGR